MAVKLRRFDNAHKCETKRTALCVAINVFVHYFQMKNDIFLMLGLSDSTSVGRRCLENAWESHLSELT